MTCDEYGWLKPLSVSEVADHYMEQQFIAVSSTAAESPDQPHPAMQVFKNFIIIVTGLELSSSSSKVKGMRPGRRVFSLQNLCLSGGGSIYSTCDLGKECEHLNVL